MNVTVQIRPAHIERGQRNENVGCPVSLAIVEALKLPEACVVSCTLKGVTILVGAARVYSSPLPAQITRFVEKLDDGEKVEPTKFMLRAIDVRGIKLLASRISGKGVK